MLGAWECFGEILNPLEGGALGPGANACLEDEEGAEGGKRGVWGAETVGESAEKSGPDETTGEVWYHEGRGEWSLGAGCDVMSVGGGRILGSWIHWSAACLFRLPWTAASLSTRGTAG